MIKIPLRNRAGETIAEALVDDELAFLVSKYRWSLANGYAARTALKRERDNGWPSTIRMHRQILGLIRQSDLEIDHLNRDKLDNRLANLRVVDRSTNMRNVDYPNKKVGATSQHRGVHWDAQHQKWVAKVSSKRLGMYNLETDAAAAARQQRALVGGFPEEIS